MALSFARSGCAITAARSTPYRSEFWAPFRTRPGDWVIDKLMVGITYDSDIDKARKLIKQIGLDLAKDPEFAPLILEPLKMQGVDALGDFAVQLRMKMMTLPGENFVIRRQALAMIKKTFDANGVKFAFPTVQIAGDGEPSAPEPPGTPANPSRSGGSGIVERAPVRRCLLVAGFPGRAW